MRCKNQKAGCGPASRWRLVLASVGLLLLFGLALPACRKKNTNIQVFQYTTLEDGTLQITGLTDKGRADNRITIPAQLNGCAVTAVAAGAFRDCTNLREVIIEEGILTIAENAFFNCVYLEEITFPQSLKAIGTNAVKNTRWEADVLQNAEEIVIHDILVEVHTQRTHYQVPENIRMIASGAFYNHTGITAVKLPDGLESIGSYAFSGCTLLSEIDLPRGLVQIGYGAFSGCTSLAVYVPETVQSIGTDAFLDVPSLTYGGSPAGAPWGARQE